MELQPRLIEVSTPRRAEGAVLVLHGGASRRETVRVSPAQLSVVRMIPVARRAARVAHRRLAVYRLLNSTRGWATSHTPVHDARWALEKLAERHGEGMPVCLVGHSLGGRAALLSADRPQVHGVVALAPWVYPTDVPQGPIYAPLLIVHGDADRVASPDRSAELARRLAGRAEIAYVTVRGGRHAMLARRRLFERLAADFAAVKLLGAPPRTRAIAQVQAGESWLTV